MATMLEAPDSGVSLPSGDAAGQHPPVAALDFTDPTTPRTLEFPKSMTQDLQHSLESTIRDLHRQLDQRNGFIDHLESSLNSAQTENAALNGRLKETSKHLRKARSQIDITEELVSRDRDDLVSQVKSLQRDNAVLRDTNASLKTAAKHHDEDTDRSEKLLEKERAARVHDRQRYQRLVDLAEERLELLAVELTRLQSGAHHPAPDTKYDSPKSSDRTSLTPEKHQTTRDSFLPQSQDKTLADELETSSISSLEEETPTPSLVHIRQSLVSSSDTLVSPEVDIPSTAEGTSDYFASPASTPEEPIRTAISSSHVDQHETQASSAATEGQPDPVFATPMTSPLLDHNAFPTIPPSIGTQTERIPDCDAPSESQDAPEPIIAPENPRVEYKTASTQTDDLPNSEQPRLGQARKVSLRPLQLPALAIRSTERSTPTSPRPSVTAGSPLSDGSRVVSRSNRASTRFPTKRQRPQTPPAAIVSMTDDDADADAEEDPEDRRPSEMSRRLLDELRQFSAKADRTLALDLTSYDTDVETAFASPTADREFDSHVHMPNKKTPRVDSLADLREAPRPAFNPARPRHARSDPALRITTDIVNAPTPPFQVPSRRSSRGMTIMGPHAQAFRQTGARLSQRHLPQDTTDASSDEESTVPRSRASKASLWNAQRADGMHSRRESMHRPHASSIASTSTWTRRPSISAPTEDTTSVAEDAQSKEQLIDAIASTMMGEWMWKTPRKRRPSLDLQRAGNKQRRWVWISLEQRTIMWSSKEPKTESALASTPARTLPIKTILDVKDTDRAPTKPGQPPSFGRSIVVQTPERSLKFNAANAQRHYAWLMSLSYVANPTQLLPGVPRVPSMSALPSKKTDKPHPPRLRKRSLSRRSSVAAFSDVETKPISSAALITSWAPQVVDPWDLNTGYVTSDGEGLAPETREAIASMQTESWSATPMAKRTGGMARISSLSTLQSQATTATRKLETPRQSTSHRKTSRPDIHDYDWTDGRAVADLANCIVPTEMATTPAPDGEGVVYRPVRGSVSEGLNEPRPRPARTVSSESQAEGDEKRRGQVYVYDPAKDDVLGGF